CARSYFGFFDYW
nr:immunoglobulin heavy chain junction region [Mus musculus]